MFRKIPNRLRFPLKLALFIAGCTVLYINWPALRGRECSGLSRTRDAMTIGYYKPRIMVTAQERRANWYSVCTKNPDCTVEDLVSEDAYLKTISLAVDYFAKCTAERGMKYCKYVGTNPQGYAFWSEGKGGPAADEMDKYRYVVSQQEAGQKFSMQFYTANPPMSYPYWSFDTLYSLRFSHREDLWGFYIEIDMRRCLDDPKKFKGGFASFYTEGWEIK